MSDKARILVVDDEQSMREFLEIFFRREGYDVTTASDAQTAIVRIENDDFDVVISDMQMPEGSGLDILERVNEIAPETVFIVITAFASTDSAISAMREGAYDYITKPFKVDEIRVTVEKALEKKLLATENRRLRTELRGQVRHRAIIGNGPSMQRVFDLVAQVADTKTNVLVSGESGTGKELVARAIHDQSDRSARPFVAVNCGAIPENLLESELFGHVKGAFTGAVQTKEGLFETADGGTLFLDEVGELTVPLQVKLLRAIQEKTIRRVGGTTDSRIDVRIISASNRDLQVEVEEGRFREDLYYRLNVIQVELPSLRERTEDIPLLVHHFIEKYADELGKPIEGISDEALERLCSHAFPGNVRELENLIERAVALARGPEIGAENLPTNLSGRVDQTVPTRIPEEGVDLDQLMNAYESALLCEALSATGGVKKRAAQLLGISFRSFRYRLEKLGLDDGRPGSQ
ncbi:MAG: sigma-54-dependent transcriptional regulator [Myxococcota bacterium]